MNDYRKEQGTIFLRDDRVTFRKTQEDKNTEKPVQLELGKMADLEQESIEQCLLHHREQWHIF